MARFHTEPAYTHGQTPKTGILLVNLGSPDEPTPPAVRRYLREFLSDPCVVEIPRPVWWLILNLFVLTTRPKDSAARYAQVWTRDGSPLMMHTAKQASLLQGFIGERSREPLIVDFAMRYGKPAIAGVIDSLKARGCDRILLLPLYPQYSGSTTATALNAAYGALSGMRNQPALRTVRNFHDDPGYIDAVANSIREYRQSNGRGDHLLLSFHGVPRFTLDKGDPYHCECLKTGRLIREALNLREDDCSIAFQSRFGRAEWLKPYTAEVIVQLAKNGIGRLDVACPGFVSDCLETLEEIAIEAKATFLEAGGQTLNYIPCLNERDDWIHALTDLALRHLAGWERTETAAGLAASSDRARQLGAAK
jgi:ferrochelatase